MSKKIHKLEEEDKTDYLLFVIASSENDYRISWLLNNELQIDLSRQEDLAVYHKRLQVKQKFSRYEYHDEERLLQFRLISNRGENGILLEEMPNIDFVLQIIGEWNDAEASDLLARVNALEGIALVYQVEPAALKSGGKLSI